MKILAIDDDEDIRYAVSLAFDLYWQGAEVLTASSGSQGVRIIGEQIPDILILDLDLPDIDGLKLCHKIQERYVVPVIVLTGSDREEDGIAALDFGADDYVTKPFSPKELIARAWAVARRHQLPMWSEDSLTPMFAEG